MYRMRQLFTVKDVDGWNEAIALLDEANKLSASKGWVQGTFFYPVVGRFNELCVEFEYPDLATMERENKELMAEPGIGKLMRRIDAIPLEGPGHSELWKEATPVPD